MGNQIIPDDGLDVAALGIGEALRGSGQRRAAERQSEQSGKRKRNEGIGKSFCGEFPAIL